MVTIKSYTDIEQSKKLAKILPLESADMWHHGFFNPSRMCKIEYNPPAPYHSVTPQWDCPCWSLPALLDILPEELEDNHFLTLQKEKNEYCCCYEDINGNSFTHVFANNPIDACVEMIVKLHELNLL